tara:strand:- start:2717 stop:2884 length:168 start_codon:yes stop_codon:yes gene_type:complete
MGRPKIDDKDRKVSVHITLSQEHAKLLKELGDGNTSKAIEGLVESLVEELAIRGK